MNGVHLRLYTCENRMHDGLPVYEWLLERARKMGIPGGSVFRAMAGYGRHGKLHEQAFFELAGEEPVLVEFILADEEADRLLQSLRDERLQLFYARIPAEFGFTAIGGEAA